MGSIGKINIIYRDVELTRMLLAKRDYRPERISTVAEHAEYLLPEVTRETLKIHNVIVDTARDNCVVAENWGAILDEVVFSGRAGTLYSVATACFAYTFFTGPDEFAAIGHALATRIYNPEFHRKTVRYALANLKQIAPGSQIFAHICGGCTWDDRPAIRGMIEDRNRKILDTVVTEMLNWDVEIITINVGDNCLGQEFNTVSREYYIKMPPSRSKA